MSVRQSFGVDCRQITAEKMKQSIWLRPELVARIQFPEWAGAGHIYTKFVALREDKDPSKVARET